MKVNEIIKIMEELIAPPNLAEDWDSPGLKTGSLYNDVNRVMTCLDVTVDVVKEAQEKGCEMIISHHPLIFKSISEVTQETTPALYAAVKAGITVFSAHTNLDYAPGGINDSLASAIGLVNIIRDYDGKHTYGTTDTPIKVRDLVEDIKARLKVPYVKVILPRGKTLDEVISKVGVSCGAFDHKNYWFEPCGIEVLVTGEIHHFDFIELSRENIITIGAGHFFTEYPGVIKLSEKLKEYGIDCIYSQTDINLYNVL